MKMIKLSEPYFFGNELNFLKKTLKDKWISANGKIVKTGDKSLALLLEQKGYQGIIEAD